MVAKSAGVSLATASYAVGNNPKISGKTRIKVQRVARKLGYIPNPELGRLMHLLRAGRTPAQQSTIALLSFNVQPRVKRNNYWVRLVEGVYQRGKELGYSVDPITVDPKEIESGRLTKILSSRGAQGVLIPPLHQVIDCAHLAEWTQFSVVAATYTAQNLAVNRVVPHHLQIGMLALEVLRKKGFKRVGLITEAGDHERVIYSFLAALAMHQQMGRFARIPALLYPANGAVAKWYEKNLPDVILTTESHLAVALREIIGARRIANSPIFLLNHPGQGLSPISGTYQHPEIVGRIAVDLLAAQIQRGERGFVQHPNATMVEGSWIDSCANYQIIDTK